MFDLTGKRALVTGASGGIGGAIARGLHEQGAIVALSGTRREALETRANALGGRTHILPANLTDAGAADKLIGEAEAAMGGLDILVNNAGITRDGLAMRLKDDDWEAVIELNLGTVFRLTRAALRGMMKQRAGRIISIGSISGVIGNPGQANYAAAKAGIVGMSKAIAQEVATRGITVNCVAPGFIATAMTDAVSEKTRERFLSGIPLGRLGTVEEVAACVAFLAADEASYVTGQTLHVNGGMAMI
ncbi:MAG: 3-oxoacyl-[acyl-carrier-protein] reductase [Rhodospirillaceae bacterium]|nr:3-oxoacyl-[acyl-carrier-protein] reductase [Rhodospirillaceae bacterium]